MPEPRVIFSDAPPPKRYPPPFPVRNTVHVNPPAAAPPPTNFFYDALPPKKPWPLDQLGDAFPVFSLPQVSLAQLQTEFEAEGPPRKVWTEQVLYPNVALYGAPPPATPLPFNAQEFMFELVPAKFSPQVLKFDSWYQNAPVLPAAVVGITSAYDERFVVHIAPRAFTVSIPDPTISYRVL